MTAVLGFLVTLLTGPLLTTILAIVRAGIDKGLTESQIRAEVEKTIITSVQGMHGKQVDLFIEEVQSEDPWVRRWRPGIAIAFTGVLLWYALFVPVFVNWLGMPPLRVGDQLLEWIVTLLAGTLGVFTVGRTLEKIASVFRR